MPDAGRPATQRRRGYSGSPEILSASRRASALTRHRGADDPVTLDAGRDLRAARLRDQIRAAVDQAPPLTPQQITELQAILSSAAAPDLDASGLFDAGEA